MSFLRGAALTCTIMLLTLTVLLLTIGLTARTFLYPEPYIKSLHNGGAFGYVENQLTSAPAASFIKIPEGGVEQLTTELLTNMLAYLRSDTDELDLTIKIDQPKLRSFFVSQIETISICETGTEPDFDNLEELCRRPGQTSDALLDELLLAKNLSFFADDTVDLTAIYGLESNTDNRARLETLRGYIRTYYYVLTSTALLALLLITALFFIEQRTLNKTMRGTSIPLLLAGLLLLISTTWGATYSDARIATLPLVLAIPLARAFVSTLTQTLYFYAGLLTALGAILLIFSFLLSTPRKNHADTKESPKKSPKLPATIKQGKTFS